MRETDIPQESLIKINKLLEKNRQNTENSEDYSVTIASNEEIIENGAVLTPTPAVSQMDEDDVSMYDMQK